LHEIEREIFSFLAFQHLAEQRSGTTSIVSDPLSQAREDCSCLPRWRSVFISCCWLDLALPSTFIGLASSHPPSRASIGLAAWFGELSAKPCR